MKHLLTLIALCQVLSPTWSFAATAKNVLLIISDDLRTELGCYGQEHMVTPNIDRLAKRGTLFTRAYVQQAVCSASRASFLTGLRPDSTGADYPYSHYFVNTILKQYPTISTYFYEKGYYTRSFGKIHHGPMSDQLSEKHFSPSSSWALEENRKRAAMPGGTKNIPPYESADVPDNAFRDGQLADAVVEALGELDNDKPFFFAVGFYKPHLPFQAPKKYWDLYDEDHIELSPNPELPRNAPDYATRHYTLSRWNSEQTTPHKNVTDAYARKLRHGYYAAVSYMDAQAGKVLDELDRLGLRNDTIVVFISDHGWHLGDQGMWGKTTNFENATLSPLIISVPGLSDQGMRSDAFVEYVDLFSTLADLVGLPVPDHLEGTSIKPLLENLDRPWKKAAFSQFPRGNISHFEGYAIRTPRYRYVEWRNNDTNAILARELYDHEVDRHESNNIALDVQYDGLVSRLSEKLREGWRTALPEGIENSAKNPKAPAPYAWGVEGKGRRETYIKKYGKAPEGAVYIDTQDIRKVGASATSVFWLVLPSLALFVTLTLLLRHRFLKKRSKAS